MKIYFKIFVLVCFVLQSVELFSQNYATSIGAGAGYSGDGLGIMASYNYHVNKAKFVQFSVFSSTAEDKSTSYTIPYSIFSVQGGYFWNVWEEPRFKKHKISLGGGVVVGYEVLNKGNNELPNGAVINGDSKFVYGGFVGAEYEFFISNDFAAVLNINEYYHVNSDIGNWYLYGGISLRYYIF